jgi:predicted amidohydrolase
MHVVFVNGVGELEVRGRRWSLYGGSMIVSATGDPIARASGGEETLTGFLPAAALGEAANVFPVLRDRRPDAYGDLVASRTTHARLRPGRLD